jgi:hypothetical protein
MRTRGHIAVAVVLALGLGAGCAAPVRFPASPIAQEETPAGLTQAYDLDGDRRPDYFTTRGADGRKATIAYDTSGDGKADAFVRLDDIRLPFCRHLVLVLDGMPYGVVEAYREQGGLRLFYPPSRLISTYPAMTDLALADLLRSVPCLSLEARYFNHGANGIAGGDADYLSMKNEAWARCLDYRAGTIWDAIAYVYPNQVFAKELADVRNLFDRRDRRQVTAYLVSTAGMATHDGIAGMLRQLDLVDRLSEELVWQTRGLVKITIMSDHGHTLMRSRRIDFRPALRAKGWRVADRLEGPRDVVPIEYGLITYTSFATRDRAGLAADLATCEGVRLVSYADADAIVVKSADGEARIERRGDRYRYRAASGDPLELVPVFADLAAKGLADADGFVADRALFDATAAHTYPDAADRLWRLFHGLVENPPDVIVDLAEGYYAGLESRAAWYRTAASTHGDLEQASSTAVILSTAGPLPPALRSRDVPEAMEKLTGSPWPPPREGRK